MIWVMQHFAEKTTFRSVFLIVVFMARVQNKACIGRLYMCLEGLSDS